MLSNANVLLEEEQGWVKALDAASKAAGIAAPNKFMLASFAIQSKGDSRAGLERIEKYVQCVRKYRLDEISPEDATAWMQRRLPATNFFLCENHTGMLVFGAHRAQTEMSVFEDEEDFRYFLKTQDMSLQAVNSTLSRVRDGIAVCINMKGCGIKHFCMKTERKKQEHSYPVKVKEVYVVDPPSYLGMLLKMSKLFWSSKALQRIKAMPAEKLTDYVATSQLPTDLGGSSTEQFVKQRAQLLLQRYRSVAEVEQGLVV